MNQRQRVFKAMLEGETVSRLWAAKQFPLVAQPTNRANEIKEEGIPVQKIRVHPIKGATFMTYFLKEEWIKRFKSGEIELPEEYMVFSNSVLSHAL